MPLNIQVRAAFEVAYVPASTLADRERSLVAVIKMLLEADGVDERHRRQLIDIALWKYTEAAGISPHPKYNLRFVSDGARDLETPASINHEHVWPRKWVLDQLFARQDWSSEALEEFLGKHAVACVVTVNEHAELGNVGKSGWQRYAAAKVSVWDRLERSYLDLGSGRPVDAPRVSDPIEPSPAERFNLNKLIDTNGAARAPLLKRLVRTARFMSAVSVVSVKKDGSPSSYFRIHDVLLPDPTRAVAYPHWTGRVAFGLRPAEVPYADMQKDCVGFLQDDTFAVSCKVTDDASLAVAEELQFLALNKIRATGD